jgi:tripartite-type tricarboxylate transporter receptor subunit TctC
MTVQRRQFLRLAAGAAALPAIAGSANAQAYPARNITLVVPFPPAGSTDVAARIVGDHMSKTLGRQVVIQNVSGAGGTVGSTRVARAEPDGYTLLVGHMGTHAAAVALYANLPYKPDVDFEPIGTIMSFPLIIAARKDFPAKDLKEFVAYVKANQSKLNMGHPGVGSIFFTGTLMLNSILGIKPTLVPFSGGAPTMNALVGGTIDIMIGDLIVGLSQHGSGNIKIYAIAAPERSPLLPGVPTTKEAGLPDFQVLAWNAMFAPKGTPKPILDTLSGALDKALDDETSRKRIGDLGSNIPDKKARGQEPLRALIKSEIARWTPVIEAANVKIK